MLARASQDATQRASLLRGITEALDEPARDGGWAAALRARANSELTDLDGRSTTSTRTSPRACCKAADERAAPRRRHGHGGARSATCSRPTTSLDASGRRKPRRCWRRWTCGWMRRAGMRLVVGSLGARVRARSRLRAQGAAGASICWRARGPRSSRFASSPGRHPERCASFRRTPVSPSREFALIKPAPEIESRARPADERVPDGAAGGRHAHPAPSAANDMTLAWQASSAAAGALLLLDRAREELQRLSTPPVQ